MARRVRFSKQNSMGSQWLELSVRAPQEFVEPLSHIFTRYGQGVAVEIEGGFNPDEGETESTEGQWATVKTYLPIDPTTESRQSQIDVGVRLVAKVAPISPLERRILDEREWESAWKKSFFVLRVGRRIVIRPPWRKYKPRPDDAVVNLDPGMAFGTGHHPTTRMCLLEMERLVTEGAEVLDVGAGSGILSIAAVKLGASRSLALDVDQVAVEVAKENVRKNGVGASIQVKQGSLPSTHIAKGSFDLAMANISAKAVVELAPHLVSSLRPGGALVASGVIEERREEVEESLVKAGAVIERTCTSDDWVAFTAVASVE